MRSQMPVQSLWRRAQGAGHQVTAQTEFCAQQSLVSPLCNPAKLLRRQTLVSELFKHVEEIQRIDHGYAFRFHRPDNLEDLLGNIAEYIVFESLNSPQLTFTIVEEPQTRTFWLQVRGLEGDVSDSMASVPSDSPEPSFVRCPANQFTPESSFL